MYEVSSKYPELLSNYRMDMIFDKHMDRQMDRQTDGCKEKNNMSSDPEGGDIIDVNHLTITDQTSHNSISERNNYIRQHQPYC